MKIAILRNEDPRSSLKWELACQKLNLEFQVIDLTSARWFSQIHSSDFNFFLLKPPGLLSHYKTLYDERTYIITKVLKCKTYPSYEECYIYENKKLLSYFLMANNFPHPATHVFYNKDESLSFLNTCKFPLVAKTTIGASGSGVMIIKDRNEAAKYINRAFSKKGIKRRFGPNRITGTPSKWLLKSIKAPSYLTKKIKEYLSIYTHGERDLVLFQDYIPHNFEWRAVKIGDSYFAHKKIKTGDKASGSKGIDFVNPPLELLNFIKKLCDRFNFNFMAIDMFEINGSFLINELQTIFGHVQDHIMEVNGVPGRYVFRNESWIFEPGDFNANESYDLRLRTALELFRNGR